MRKLVALLTGVLVLAGANWTIVQRENLWKNGVVVRLELAPVDPRSLMQGDYMALRFRVADEARGAAADGRIVVRADARGIARFVRRDTGGPRAEGEIPLRYRIREGQVKFATNAWFFQEGHAKYYENARYGEFRVSPSGDMLLTAMLGESLERLGPPRR